MVPALTTGRALAASAIILVACSVSLCRAFVAPRFGSTPLSTPHRRGTPIASGYLAAIKAGQQRSTIPPRRAMTMEGGGDKTKVLFVCLGNICRSPTAEAVFKQVTSKAGAADKFDIESCGTGGGNPGWYKEGGESYHTGDSPDSRMTAAAEKRGVILEGASRPLTPADLDNFDLIVGMDAANAKAMTTAAEYWGKSEQAASKLRTMTSYCRASGNVKSVPDPYFGGPKGFETVLDLLDDACQGLLEKCLAGDA